MRDSLDLLENSEIFADLDEATAKTLASSARILTIKFDESLPLESAKQPVFYLIDEGQIQVTRDDGHSWVLGTGDWFGESALFGSPSQITEARALSRASVLVLSEESIKDLRSGAGRQPLLDIAVNMISSLRGNHNGHNPRRTSVPTRVEKDLLGEREIPKGQMYGIQTLRAKETFSITGRTLADFPLFIKSLAQIKQAAARTNHSLGLLDADVTEAIVSATNEIIAGGWNQEFVVDMLQGGAGTSVNMNVNEVIANRALEIMGHERGDHGKCHPNNHVNLAQSTNDVYPTAMRMAIILYTRELIRSLGKLKAALGDKAEEFKDVLKMGRTHLQDAVPMTLGQEFQAFRTMIDKDIELLEGGVDRFLVVNLGGTAIGTGIAAEPEYQKQVVPLLAEISDLPLEQAEDLFAATADAASYVSFFGDLKRVAVGLSKISNDLRLLASGPSCGLAEIILPEVQPGSSIMPGKINPVIPELVNQVAFQVMGRDLTTTLAAEAGQLQLNVMKPVVALNTFESIEMLRDAAEIFTERCIKGIKARPEHTEALVNESLALLTALLPHLGYKLTSELSKEIARTGRTARQIILENGYLKAQELDEILSPEAMTRPRSSRPK